MSVENKTLKLGFIGGSIESAVGYTHYVASRMDGDWELVCGCFSTQEDVNKETGRQYGVAEERVYASWQDLLSQEKSRADAIVILTPTPQHYEMVKACLKQKIPVICEKALSIDSASAQKLDAYCEQQKGFLAVTYNYSGYPMVRELRQSITEGKLGELCHFQIEMPQEGFLRTDQDGQLATPQAWRLRDGELPTLYLDLGVHVHQLAAYLLDIKPVQVVAQQGQYGGHEHVIDNVSCLAEYEKGIQGQFWFGKSALGHRNGLKISIYGSKASAQWRQNHPEELLINHVDGRREIIDRGRDTHIAGEHRYNRFKAGHPAGFVEAFANLYRDIASCLRNFQQTGAWQSQDVYSADFASEGLQLLEAMVTSAQEKRWVGLDKRVG